MIKETTAGYFSFKEIIEDGQKALDAKLYRIALMLALIIPSVCSRVEFKDNPKYKDETGRWRDRDCYVDWCLLQNIKFLDAEEKYGNVDENRLNEDYCQHIYEIRCGVVHESAVQCDNVVCNLCANDNRAICKTVNCDKANQYDICVVPFCKQMFEIGAQYYDKHKNDFNLASMPMRMYEFL